MSLSRFRSLFVSTFNEPPATIYNRILLSRAAQKLALSDLPVGEVAEQLGYRTPSHFAEAFHRDRGMAPGEYRRRVRRAAIWRQRELPRVSLGGRRGPNSVLPQVRPANPAAGSRCLPDPRPWVHHDKE